MSVKCWNCIIFLLVCWFGCARELPPQQIGDQPICHVFLWCAWSSLTYITVVVLPSPVENKNKQANNELSPSFPFWQSFKFLSKWRTPWQSGGLGWRRWLCLSTTTPIRVLLKQLKPKTLSRRERARLWCWVFFIAASFESCASPGLFAIVFSAGGYFWQYYLYFLMLWTSPFSKYLPNSMACRLYLLAVLIQTAIDVCLEADILIQFGDLPSKAATQDETENQRRLPVYLGIFAFAQCVLSMIILYFRLFTFACWQHVSVYSRYWCGDIPEHSSIHFPRVRSSPYFIQWWLYPYHSSLFNGALLLYAGIQISEIRAIFPPNKTGVFSKIPITVLTDIIPVVIGIAEIVYIGLGWKIYTEFGWKVYKLLGADRQIKKMYAQYQVFECLLKFDVFFWLGFSIQVKSGIPQSLYIASELLLQSF